MIPLALNLNHKNVLIVGGGKVALRKARQFVEEGAHVFVVSSRFDEAFLSLDLSMIEDVYQCKYLNDMFLVYAATDNLEVNEQIVLDCEKARILCGSATFHSKASFYSMSTRKVKDIQLSLSTGQTVPYTKPILDEMEEVLKKHEKKIRLLGLLRPYIISTVENKRAYFEKLFACDDSFLVFLYQSILEKKGIIYVYHTTDTKEKYPVSDLVLSLKEFEMISDLLVFEVDYTIVPLIISDGFIYRQLKGMLRPNCHLALPLLNDEKDIKKVLSLYQNDTRRLICMLHPRGSNNLKQAIASILQSQGLVYDFEDEMTLDISYQYRLVPFLMTHGSHYEDLLEVLKVYQTKGYDIEICPIIGQNLEVIQMLKRS